MSEQIIAFFSLVGFWSYSTVLLYCSVTNPPKCKFTLVVRIIIGLLALYLGYAFYLRPIITIEVTLTNCLLILFRLMISISAYVALRKPD